MLLVRAQRQHQRVLAFGLSDHYRQTFELTRRTGRGGGHQRQGQAADLAIQGFGKMWQKTYTVRMPGELVSADDLIATWKQRFPEFWPEGNTFYGPLTGIAPGEVALLNVTLPGKMSCRPASWCCTPTPSPSP